jgi:hypothetical protein
MTPKRLAEPILASETSKFLVHEFSSFSSFIPLRTYGVLRRLKLISSIHWCIFSTSIIHNLEMLYINQDRIITQFNTIMRIKSSAMHLMIN